MRCGEQYARRLLVDGADDCEGRGLMVLSALSLAAAELTSVEVRVLNGDDPIVRTAVEVLSRETGLAVVPAPRSANPEDNLAHASLFVAVVASMTGRLQAMRAAAGVPAIVPVQFPGPHADAHTLSLLRAAHDPRVLGRLVVDALGLRQ